MKKTKINRTLAIVALVSMACLLSWIFMPAGFLFLFTLFYVEVFAFLRKISDILDQEKSEEP